MKNEIINIMKSWKKATSQIKENSKQIILSIGLGSFICALLTASYYKELVTLNHNLEKAAESGIFPGMDIPISIPLSIPYAITLSFTVLITSLLIVLPEQNHSNVKCCVWLGAFALEIGTVTMTVAMGELFYGYWISSMAFSFISVYILIDILKAIRIWAKDESGYDVAKLTLIWAVLAVIIGKLV